MRSSLKAAVALPVVQRIAITVVVFLADWLVAKTENQFDDKLLAAIKEASGQK